MYYCLFLYILALIRFFITGNVKRLLAPKIGLEPEEQVLIFQGKQKHDEQHLHLEGVCDNSEIYLLNFVSSSRGRQPEEMRENVGMPEAFEAVARVRAEVDQLSESVSPHLLFDFLLKKSILGYNNNMIDVE